MFQSNTSFGVFIARLTDRIHGSFRLLPFKSQWCNKSFSSTFFAPKMKRPLLERNDDSDWLSLSTRCKLICKFGIRFLPNSRWTLNVQFLKAFFSYTFPQQQPSTQIGGDVWIGRAEREARIVKTDGLLLTRWANMLPFTFLTQKQ